jgi:LmbE family N-acetylglucosaminyl deacetylase
VIVAHPDDETLWAGGTILSHPDWTWWIVTLCRASDADRAPRFRRALDELGARGSMADLEDGPEQRPLEAGSAEAAILRLVSSQRFDLVISHDRAGEYTRHRRHEETARAVVGLWHAGKLDAAELWTFAYEDGGKTYLPHPIATAPIYMTLPEHVWRRKYDLITEVYGFHPNTFEARTTPRAEAFWRFTSPAEAVAWLRWGGGLP